MLGKAYSPLLNLEWNPKSNNPLRHGFPLAALTVTPHASSTSNDSTMDSNKLQPPTVSRSRATFGRLKVERVRISRPKELLIQEKQPNPPLTSEDEDEGVNSNRKRGGNRVTGGSVPRGWNLRYDSPDSKFMPTASDFFSRKSFRDAGYSDFMIDCLQKQHFHRPSHIQV